MAIWFGGAIDRVMCVRTDELVLLDRQDCLGWRKYDAKRVPLCRPSLLDNPANPAIGEEQCKDSGTYT